jgi:hypothetical protein
LNDACISRGLLPKMQIVPHDVLVQRPRQAHARIPLLVAAHMLACTAPLLMLLPHWPAPLRIATHAPSLGAMFSLAAWIGLGNSRLMVRVLGGFGATAYLAIWLPITIELMNRQVVNPHRLFGDYISVLGIHIAYVGTLTLAFLVVQRWWRIERAYDVSVPPTKDWRQFSMLNLLALMVATAIVLTFVQVSRMARLDGPGYWQWATPLVGAIGIFFVNSWLAVRAALSPPPLAPRLVGTIIVAALLGIAIELSMGNAVSGWSFAIKCAILLVATLIVIGSTLVVRSCGYRLVPRTPRGNASPATANTQACEDFAASAPDAMPIEPSPP